MFTDHEATDNQEARIVSVVQAGAAWVFTAQVFLMADDRVGAIAAVEQAAVALDDVLDHLGVDR